MGSHDAAEAVSHQHGFVDLHSGQDLNHIVGQGLDRLVVLWQVRKAAPHDIVGDAAEIVGRRGQGGDQGLVVTMGGAQAMAVRWLSPW